MLRLKQQERVSKAVVLLESPMKCGIVTIHNTTTQIASAAEEQTTVEEEINQSIIRISDVSV